jgi:MoaA/NifB/PqqE/SkfB family radical SAM enzyme
LLAHLCQKLKVSRCVSKPVFLFIEPSSLCNLECPFCPCGSGDRRLKTSFMDLSNFKMVINKTYPYIIGVGLYLYGEPLLNKDIVKMVEYSSSKGILSSVHTNMNIMDEGLAVGLIKAGLFNLVFSVDGCTQGTYGKFRVGGDIERVFKNVEIFINTRKKLKSKNPIVSWQYLVNKYNEHEIDMARSIAKRLKVDFFVENLFLIPEEKRKDWATDIEARSLYDKVTFKEKRKPQDHCADLWDTFRVDCEGGAYICCFMANEQKNTYGNIFTKSLEELWNSEEMFSARRAVRGALSDKSWIQCGACKYLPDNFNKNRG